MQNLLFSLGIETIRDLIFYFPFRWDDFSNTIPISRVTPDQKITIKGRVISAENKFIPFRRLTITEALISDQTASIKAVWFNQSFIKQSLEQDKEFRFSGTAKISKNSLILQSPSFEDAARKITQTGGLIPVYHVTQGITPKKLRYFIRQALPAAKKLPEYLPRQIIKNQNLIPLAKAISQIHFSGEKSSVQQAKKRLGFDELFIFQLNYQLKKAKWRKNKALKIRKNIPFIKQALKKLPFKLTDDQKIALWEIIKDSSRNIPANRLLQGDVGSGKTIVATLACLNAAQSLYQSAIMAPTEILAKQHYQKIAPLAQKFNLPCALLTNALAFISQKTSRKIKKQTLLKKIQQSKIKLVIGTHAIIQKAVSFKNLGLVIIDEQHRFGVKQRAYLLKQTQSVKDGPKTTTPHLVSMTATPIPRTLALTVYGDLDISNIKTLPAGRKKIITRVVPPQKRPQAYEFIRREIKKGRQAFIICPLIQESEIIQTKAAVQEYQTLSGQIFPDLKVGLIHGQLKPKQKQTVMSRFSRNKLQILVSTSVVEVGVDIPNAAIIVIEGAERFGLSQLHQFRGRVGRGQHQSYCLLFTESPSPKTWKRLKYMEQTQNGFLLAQKDLNLRGPGEFLGEKQSGYSNLTVASLKDLSLIKASREEAQNLVQNDPQLKTAPRLKKRLERFSKDIHFE